MQQIFLDAKFAAEPRLRARLFLLLGNAGIVVLPNPTKKEVAGAVRYISENDVPILAGAMEHSEYLVTLDKEFFGSRIGALAAKRGLVILTPGLLIDKYRRAEAA